MEKRKDEDHGERREGMEGMEIGEERNGTWMMDDGYHRHSVVFSFMQQHEL